MKIIIELEDSKIRTGYKDNTYTYDNITDALRLYKESRAKMDFCQLLNEAIDDEDNAPKMYSELMFKYNNELPQKEGESTILPSGHLRLVRPVDAVTNSVITSITKDEQKHKDLLLTLKDVFC